MSEDAFKEQCRILAGQMDHWLELFDTEYSYDEIPIRDRPLRAMIALCREGAFELHAGEQTVDISKPHEHADTNWFRAVFAAVEHWYTSRFGSGALEADTRSRLEGVISLHGAAFSLDIKALPSAVEEPGETAWLYFEDGVREDEDPVKWIINGPDLDNAAEELRSLATSQAREVATMLRFIRYRAGMADVGKDAETRKLCEACFDYLQQAARRIANAKPSERGPAWFDLQMANETALKAVIRRATGQQKHIHNLEELLGEAERHGVVPTTNRLDGWPEFKTISEWRYGQGNPGSLKRIFAAYMATLHVVQACMAAIPPAMPSGFAILLRYAPWKFRPDSVPRKATRRKG